MNKGPNHFTYLLRVRTPIHRPHPIMRDIYRAVLADAIHAGARHKSWIARFLDISPQAVQRMIDQTHFHIDTESDQEHFFIDDFFEECPCDGAIEWVATLPDASPRDLWELCQRGDWLLWALTDLGVRIPEAAYRPAVMRAVRVYAPRALRRAGLDGRAATLEALPDDVSFAVLEEASAEAKAAAWAAAEAETVAWSAEAAAKAAAEAETVAWSAAAEAAAARAARAASAAEASEAGRMMELSLSADDVRSAVPWRIVARYMRQRRKTQEEPT